jgi:hypothetical protein
MTDEFYIGWEEKAPSSIGSRVRAAVVFLLALAVVLGALLALAQRTIGGSVFEWGTVKQFSGILRSEPYPHLLVARSGASGGPAEFSRYYLVKPFKFGLDPALASRLDGRTVRLKGTLIYRGNQTMIEVVEGSLQPVDALRLQHINAATPSVNLGQQTLRGEIVDSKCYLGVMNPGQRTTHRACAIRCISGGIPPVLVVRQADGPPWHFLLVAPDGRPVNQQVLDLVAEPVEITGAVERQGDWLILRANPATYRRVAK